MQFTEFSEEWDKYMADYEATAFELIEQLRNKQQQEQMNLIQKIDDEFKFNPSKDLVALRNQEKIFFSVKDYDNAEFMRMKNQQLEMYEIDVNNQRKQQYMLRESATLKVRQDNQLQSLFKRIERDREEQVKHRQVDSQRLIQRNRNLLKDILEK